MSTSLDFNESGADYTLSYAHGTVMIIAWMIFASTGILFARYGRSLHIDDQFKILGEFIWFQIHRLALCIAAITTLIGFFLIFAQAGGTWVNVNSGCLLAHSILGIIIVCFSQIQVWIAVFRCHPDNRFRYIFNWMHRSTGLLAFSLSIPNIFLITFVLSEYQRGLRIIIFLWCAWIVIIVIIFEIIEYRCRKTSILRTDNRRKYEVTDRNSPQDVEMYTVDNSNMKSFSKIRSILFCIHIIIAICLGISFIVLIWLQDSM